MADRGVKPDPSGLKNTLDPCACAQSPDGTGKWRKRIAAGYTPLGAVFSLWQFHVPSGLKTLKRQNHLDITYIQYHELYLR